MQEGIIIDVFRIIGSPFFVSADEGQKVYEKFIPVLAEGRKVILSFNQAEIITPTFLNAAVGQLYGEFAPEYIRKFFSVIDMEQDDLIVLKMVIDNAKIYFRERQNSASEVGDNPRLTNRKQLEVMS